LGTAIRVVAAILLGSIVGLPTFSQSEQTYTAPVQWKKLRLGDPEVVVELPKMPTYDGIKRPCQEYKQERFVSYASHSVYSVTLFSKLKSAPPFYCTQPARFDDRMFKDRLLALGRGQTATIGELESKNGKQISIEFLAKDVYYRIVYNKKRKMWVELSVAGRSTDQENRAKFFETLSLDSDKSADRLKKGVERTLGDLTPTIQKSLLQQIENAEYKIIFKPRPHYTDSARHASIQGTIRLKVTLMHHGGVGAISVVEGLSHGLTEQAVAAAKRIAFLPKIVNGSPVDEVVTVEYGFRVY